MLFLLDLEYMKLIYSLLIEIFKVLLKYLIIKINGGSWAKWRRR